MLRTMRSKEGVSQCLEERIESPVRIKGQSGKKARELYYKRTAYAKALRS